MSKPLSENWVRFNTLNSSVYAGAKLDPPDLRFVKFIRGFNWQRRGFRKGRLTAEQAQAIEGSIKATMEAMNSPIPFVPPAKVPKADRLVNAPSPKRSAEPMAPPKVLSASTPFSSLGPKAAALLAKRKPSGSAR